MGLISRVSSRTYREYNTLKPHQKPHHQKNNDKMKNISTHYLLRLFHTYLYSFTLTMASPDDIKNLIDPHFSPNLKQALEGEQISNALSQKSILSHQALAPSLINSDSCKTKNIQDPCH